MIEVPNSRRIGPNFLHQVASVHLDRSLLIPALSRMWPDGFRVHGRLFVGNRVRIARDAGATRTEHEYEIPTLRPSEFPTSQNRNSDRRVRDRFHVAAFKAVTRRPFVQDSLGGLSRKYDSGSSPDEPLLLRCALIAPSGKMPPVSLPTTHFWLQRNIPDHRPYDQPVKASHGW